MSDDASISVGFLGHPLGAHVSSHRPRIGRILSGSLRPMGFFVLFGLCAYLSRRPDQLIPQVGVVFYHVAALVLAWRVLDQLAGVGRRYELFEGGFVRRSWSSATTVLWYQAAGVRDGRDSAEPLPGLLVKLYNGRLVPIHPDVTGYDRLSGAIDAAVTDQTLGDFYRDSDTGRSVACHPWAVSPQGIFAGHDFLPGGEVSRVLVQYREWGLGGEAVRSVFLCRRGEGGDEVFAVVPLWKLWNARAFLELAGRVVPVEQSPE